MSAMISDLTAPRVNSIPPRMTRFSPGWVFALVAGDVLMFLFALFVSEQIVLQLWRTSIQFNRIS